MRKLLLAALLAAASGVPALAYDDHYLGEIRALPYEYCPKEWVRAEGQLLPIMQNTALFSLLGNRYGGDARETFALPDLHDSVLVSKNEPLKRPTEKLTWCIAIKGLYPQRPD